MVNISEKSKHPFCKFADRFYADSDAVVILADLEQRLAVNPNIILFCAWFAKTGQKQLNKKDIQNITSSILSWHEQIVFALKTLQQKLSCESESSLKEIKKDGTLAKIYEKWYGMDFSTLKDNSVIAK